jgi:hypothetical protein
MRSLCLVHSRHVRNVFKDGLLPPWTANPQKGLHQTMSLFGMHSEIGIGAIEIVGGSAPRRHSLSSRWVGWAVRAEPAQAREAPEPPATRACVLPRRGGLQFVTRTDEMVVIGSSRERRCIAIVDRIEPKPIVPSPNDRAVVWIVVGSHNVPHPKRPDID